MSFASFITAPISEALAEKHAPFPDPLVPADQPEQRFTLGAELVERGGHELVTPGSQPEIDDPAVGGGRLAYQQLGVLGPLDELGDRALREGETFDEVGDGRALASIRSTLDHQQQEVLARREPVSARDLLAPPKERPQGSPQIRSFPVIVERRPGHARTLPHAPLGQPHGEHSAEQSRTGRQ